MAASSSQDAVSQQERQEALKRMDLQTISKNYIEKAISETEGYKALLMDTDTIRVISTVITQSELGENNVFHTERIDGNSNEMHKELKVMHSSPLI